MSRTVVLKTLNKLDSLLNEEAGITEPDLVGGGGVGSGRRSLGMQRGGAYVAAGRGTLIPYFGGCDMYGNGLVSYPAPFGGAKKKIVPLTQAAQAKVVAKMKDLSARSAAARKNKATERKNFLATLSQYDLEGVERYKKAVQKQKLKRTNKPKGVSANKWVTFVKNMSADSGVPYCDLLRNPKVSEAYQALSNDNDLFVKYSLTGKQPKFY